MDIHINRKKQKRDTYVCRRQYPLASRLSLPDIFMSSYHCTYIIQLTIFLATVVDGNGSVVFVLLPVENKAETRVLGRAGWAYPTVPSMTYLGWTLVPLDPRLSVTENKTTTVAHTQ